jgi:integrase
MPRIRLTNKFMAKLFGPERTTRPRRMFYWDDRQPGLALMLTERGAHSFIFQYRAGGKSRRLTFTRCWTIEEARRRAAEVAAKLTSGIDPAPRATPTHTLRAIAHQFLRQRGPDYRSGGDMLANLENHAGPLLDRPLEALTRGEMARQADQVAARHPHAAHRLVRSLNTIGTWYQHRTDRFVWPVVKSPLRGQTARDRVLSDAEIGAVWRAAERQGWPFGHLVRLLLLTACRRNEIAHLHRSEVDGDCLRLPPGRTKTKQPLVQPLSDMALDILRDCPEGEYPLGRYKSFGTGKRELDRLLNIAPWRLHDLRRTSATLMARCGVQDNIIERVLNHKIRGVAGVYQRHHWMEEKKAALEALATLIADITK